jgi:gamma-glutamylcyclotransferase (GGCT)/AIG2-like uncharacterized protein YtfP
MHYIFVYGTLKRGYNNNRRLLTGSEFVGEFFTKPFYRLYDLGYFPGLKIDKQAGKSIKGEIYRVSDKVLESLDFLEGHPKHYKRESLEIENFDEKVEGYIYNYDVSKKTECSPEWNCDWK